MLEVVVASGKGGVGKTLISAELILRLKELGVSVVGVDADADAPNLHLVLGGAEWVVEKEYREGRVVRVDALKCVRCGACMDACRYKAIFIDSATGEYRVNELLCEGCATCSLICPVGAIARVEALSGKVRAGVTKVGNVRIAGAKLVPGRPNSGKLVTEVKSLAKELWGSEAEVFVIDAAAGIGCQVIASLAGASAAILVAEPTPASFEDLVRVHKVVKHFGLPAALILNKSGVGGGLEDRIVKYAKKENIDFIGEIPYDDSVPKALARLTPVTKAYPDSAASVAIQRVTKLIIEKVIKDWPSWYSKHVPRRPEPYVPEIILPK